MFLSNDDSVKSIKLIIEYISKSISNLTSTNKVKDENLDKVELKVQENELLEENSSNENSSANQGKEKK